MAVTVELHLRGSFAWVVECTGWKYTICEVKYGKVRKLFYGHYGTYVHKELLNGEDYQNQLIWNPVHLCAWVTSQLLLGIVVLLQRETEFTGREQFVVSILKEQLFLKFQHTHREFHVDHTFGKPHLPIIEIEKTTLGLRMYFTIKHYNHTVLVYAYAHTSLKKQNCPLTSVMPPIQVMSGCMMSAQWPSISSR